MNWYKKKYEKVQFDIQHKDMVSQQTNIPKYRIYYILQHCWTDLLCDTLYDTYQTTPGGPFTNMV